MGYDPWTWGVIHPLDEEACEYACMETKATSAMWKGAKGYPQKQGSQHMGPSPLSRSKTRLHLLSLLLFKWQPSHSLSCFLPHVAKLRWTSCHLILPIQCIVRIQNHPSSSHIPIGPWKAYTLWQGIPPLLPPLTPLLTKAYTSLEFCVHGWGSLISHLHKPLNLNLG